MKNRRILDAIGYLDGDLVSEAADCRRKTAKIRALRWGSLAACLLIAVMAAALIVSALSVNAVSVGGIERNYKNGIQPSELAYSYPWEYRTVSEKFTEITVCGIVYHTRNAVIGEELLGEQFERPGAAQGYDDYTGETHTDTFSVYAIKGVSDERMIAVGMEGAYYVYMKREVEAPATLGELLALYGLEDTLTLESFSVYEQSRNKGYFQMEDGADIMALIGESKDASAWAEAEVQSRFFGNYISFTATSESLGSYKKVFSVIAEGYITTNVLDYRYVYYIGEEAASRIIAYAKAHSEEAESEPYEYTLAGTVTEIGEGYLLIDDSVLCKRASDGLVFRVSTDDIRIRRAVELGHVKEGDTVAVRFRGMIDPETLTVTGAQSIETGTVVSGNVEVPE